MEKFDGKICPLSIDDADNAYSYMPEVSTSSSIVYGVEAFKEQVKEAFPGTIGAVGGIISKTGKKIDEYFPNGIKLFNGSVDIKIGDKVKSVGDTLVNAANRQIEIFEEEYKKKNPRLAKAQENISFDVANQGANWTSLLLAGSVGLAGKAMGALVLSGEFKERAEKYKQEHADMGGFAEEYSDSALYNAANAYIQGIEEKYLGSWAQVKAVKKGWGFVKAIGKNAIQEGFIEEPLQDVTDFYFDKIDSFNEDEELKGRLKNNLRGYVVASVFGGAGGFGGALYQRSKGIDMYKDALKDTVPEEDLENVATKAYEQDAKTLKDVVVVEIENSSSLRNKRGEVYENMYNSTLKAVKDAKELGAYQELETEEDMASYAQAEAEKFADWTLAEANRRKTVIEEVIDSSTIAYKDGKLEIGMTTEGGMDTEYNQIAQRINEIDEEEAKKGVPEYTEPTININGVDRQTTNSDGNLIAKSKRSLEYFYNWFGDSKVVDEQGRPLVVYHGSDAEFDTFDINKIGTFGEAIGHGFYFGEKNIAERYNKGKLFAVYLRMENPVDYLNGKKIKKSQIEDVADWFNGNYIESEEGHRLFVDNLNYILKDKRIDSYQISNMLDFAEYSEKDENKENVYQDIYKKIKEITGIDGFTQETDVGKTWVVFNPNQIKSTQNRGTYSGSENIFYQESNENIYGATNSDGEPIANPQSFNIFIAGSRVTENDEPVSPENPPKKIYRGDTRYFEEYEPQENAYEYDWGKGFYLSDSEEDILNNYQIGGADLTNRIEREAEQLSQDEDVDYDEAKQKVKEKYEQEDILREFYLSIKEPVIIGGEKETFFDYRQEYDEENDEYGEPTGTLADVIYEIENYLTDIGAEEYAQPITERLYERAIDYDGLSASQVEDIIRENPESSYLIDFESGPGEMLSSVWGRLGYDGIIDHRAGTKFKNMDMPSDTTHYVVFNSEQAKSVDNKGEWGVGERNFYHQEKKGSIEFSGDKALITLTENANSSTLPHELAHYYLQNTFLYAKSGLATPEYMGFYNSIAKYLNITPDQENIKEWQQEKWARAYEQFRLGKAPDGMDAPLSAYNQWIRKAYDKASEPMYRDENGELKVADIPYETMKTFADLTGEELTEQEHKQNQEKVRGLAKSTSQMAKQKGIETETPTYEPRSQTEMGKKADEFIQNNKQLAIDIVKGLAPEQDGLFRQDLFAALRELALNEGDSDLLNELSRSMTVEEATELGQRIQALARGRIDPVKQMVELRDERMKKNKVDKKKIKEETERTTKEIKKEIALAAEPKEWQDFIKSLEC